MTVSSELFVENGEAGQATFSEPSATVETFLAYEEFGELEGGVLIAKAPILIKVSSEEDYTCAESDEYDIYTSGDTREAAVEDFMEHIRNMFIHYRDADDDRLDYSAKVLKQRFQQDFSIQ